MKTAVSIAGIAVITVCVFLTLPVAADEATPGTAGKAGVSANSLSPSALSSDPLLQRPQSDEDLSARVDALEASRAAVDQDSKSPISLSISGWVDQQVTYTRQ